MEDEGTSDQDPMIPSSRIRIFSKIHISPEFSRKFLQPPGVPSPAPGGDCNLVCSRETDGGGSARVRSKETEVWLEEGGELAKIWRLFGLELQIRAEPDSTSFALPLSTTPSNFSSSASSTKRFQNQCCFQTLSVISSIGTFFVSGKKKSTKMDIMTTQPEKKAKMPYFMWQSMERKACAMTKVKSRLVQTVTLCPADLVSSGNVSLGISQPSGPQDHAKAETKMQTINTTSTAQPLARPSEWSFTLNPSTTEITTCEQECQRI
ncbi:hypothetical protein IEQ34_004629 [Dendrobium chrysotoxum]|uniref:Uncharacterized protein n=1 Tax=Dendrobium chrysotoxum TaxID=161865 RepID=A0AAV7HFQ6_DENCH|nr:hypothetical protein IEQ34_004629 [Dendrobium chrysotoxum]